VKIGIESAIDTAFLRSYEMSRSLRKTSQKIEKKMPRNSLAQDLRTRASYYQDRECVDPLQKEANQIFKCEL